jgi:two-component sensor histidine kinase
MPFLISVQAIIDVFFTHEQDGYKHVITDNRIGLPEGLDIKKSTSSGLQLVARLPESQLMGFLTFEQIGETSFIIQFSS